MPISFASPALKTIVAVVLATSTVVAVHGRADSRAEGEPTATRLVEAPDCRGSGPVEPAKDGSPSMRPEGSTVSVALRPTVFVRLDARGRVVAAATNSGCRPRAGDDVYLFSADGKIQTGAWSDLSGCRWQGDFTVAARYQPQQCEWRERDDDRRS